MMIRARKCQSANVATAAAEAAKFGRIMNGAPGVPIVRPRARPACQTDRMWQAFTSALVACVKTSDSSNERTAEVDRRGL